MLRLPKATNLSNQKEYKPLKRASDFLFLLRMRKSPRQIGIPHPKYAPEMVEKAMSEG